MSRYIEELEEMGLSLLIYRGEEVVFSSSFGGIKPLLNAINTFGREELRGSIVADKVVGRAAALIIVYIDAAEIHAALISTGAMEVLRSHGLRFYFSEETPAIKNREGMDICPFEKLVLEVFNPEEAYRRIKAKVSGF